MKSRRQALKLCLDATVVIVIEIVNKFLLKVIHTTPETLAISLRRILAEEKYIQSLCDRNGGRLSGSQGIGDIEVHPRRIFVNPAADLLKYVRFFSAVKTYLTPKEEPNYYPITIELYVQREDQPIVKMYPKLCDSEGLKIYAYRSEEDADAH